MSLLSRIVDELNKQPFQTQADLAEKLEIPNDVNFKRVIDDAVKYRQIIPLVPNDPNTSYHSNAFNISINLVNDQ